MTTARTPVVVVGKAVVAAPSRGRWGGVACWGVHPSPLCPTRRCTSLRHHRCCRKKTDLEKRLERKLDLDYGNEDWMYTAHCFPGDSVPFDIVEPIKKKMMQKEGDKTFLFSTSTAIWICGYQSHKTKKRGSD